MQVRAALHHHAIPIRPPATRRRRGRPELTPELLGELYLAQGLSVAAIAKRTGWSSKRVRTRLREAGVPVRSVGPKDPNATPPSREVLEELYVRQGLSVAAVGRRLGWSTTRTQEFLTRFGVPTRPPRPAGSHWPAQLRSREALADLYLSQGLSSTAIAHLVGVGPRQVLAALHHHGIPVRPRGTPSRRGRPELTPELLRELSLERGLSDEAVAAQLGYTAVQVELARARHRLMRKEWRRGTERLRVDLPVDLPEHLHVEEGLTMAEVGMPSASRPMS